MRPADESYGIFERCLSAFTCSQIGKELDVSAVERSRAGARHLMGNPVVASIARKRELTDIADEWLGRASVPFRATLFDKSSNSNWLIPWHQDTALPLTAKCDAPGWTAWSEKSGVAYAHAPAWALSRVIALRVHLDDSTPANGPLRVIPGSHAAGVLSDEQVAVFVAKGGAVECCVPRGGVIAMRPLTIHCSSKSRGSAARRVLHIEYADSLALSDGMRLAVV